ncbi:hypothetical protein [Paenibacillus sp. TH7-28]
MSNLIDIIVQNYDEENNIVFIEKQGKNIWTMLSLMQFEDDMEYWDMPTQIEEVAGRKGYLFDNKIDTESLILEIQRFIYEHKLDELDYILDNE